MILLTFMASLTRRFRFALDRHNFATDFSPSSPERRLRPTADANRAAKGGGNGGKADAENCRPPAAEELGKRWRFFTTYTGV
jgi:hypothetical protein